MCYLFLTYSRWLLVHVNDSVIFLSVHPGIFVVQRSIQKFYLKAKDQSREHNKRQLQAGGVGLSDLYDDTDSIAFNMLVAPDSVIFINEYESVHNIVILFVCRQIMKCLGHVGLWQKNHTFAIKWTIRLVLD